jgi:hypothetical protein
MLVIEDHDGGKRSRNSCDMLKVDLSCMTSRVTRYQVSGQATMAADLCDRSHTVARGIPEIILIAPWNHSGSAVYCNQAVNHDFLHRLWREAGAVASASPTT